MPTIDPDFANTDGDTVASSTPWMRRPAIMEQLQRHLDPISGRLRDAGYALPDEPPLSSSTALRWAPGAKDGVGSYHRNSTVDHEQVQHIIAQLEAIACDAAAPAKRTLYDALCKLPTAQGDC